MQFCAPKISDDTATRTTEKSVFDTLQNGPFDPQIIRTDSAPPPCKLHQFKAEIRNGRMGGGLGPVTSPPYMISSRVIYLRTQAPFEKERWYILPTALMT
jgi:hypothetical protein